MTAMPESNLPRKTKSAATPDAAREISASRVFEAPRELVWMMWSDAHQLGKWWGPNGFTTTTYEFDFRPGGVWRFVMHGPDGTDYPNKFIYREIVPLERIAYSHVSGPLFEATAIFKEIDGRTEVSVRMVFESAEVRDRVEKEFGAVKGLQQNLQKLDGALVQAERDSSAAMATPTVIERTFDAPPELVFEAFTDPAQLARWWGPQGFTNPVCEVDVRPGGTIRIHMRAPNGVEYPMNGRFLEVEKPERLVFTADAFDGALENLNTITFTEERGRTKLTLTVKVLKASPAVYGALSGMREGWSQSLDKLSEVVAEEALPEPFEISRIFDAPLDRVWTAWTDPEQLAKWFGPKGATIFHSKADLRPGGIYHYGMRMPDGLVLWGRWIFREIEAPSRLVSVVSFSDENGGITTHPMSPDWPREILSTITFEALGDKTSVTVKWIPINTTAAERKTFDLGRPSMMGGWGGTLDKLEAYLPEAR